MNIRKRIHVCQIEMNKLEMMKVVDDRAPLPSRLQVTCPHKERDAIVSIQLMQVQLADLPISDRKFNAVVIRIVISCVSATCS